MDNFIISNFCVSFLLGGLSAAISKTLFYPIDRIRLITADMHLRPKEKFFEKWNGNWSAVINYAPAQALNFAFYHLAKTTINDKGIKSISEHFWLYFFVGTWSSASALLFLYPLDFTRTRFASEKWSGSGKFQNLRDCASQIYKSEGLSGFYKGFAYSLPGVVLYRGLYFGGYDTAKYMLSKSDGKNLGIGTRCILAFITTGLATVISYPLDTIRRRLIMASYREEVLYTGFVDCARKVYRNEGKNSFFKGMGSSLSRSKAGALSLVLFDEFRRLVYSYSKAF